MDYFAFIRDSVPKREICFIENIVLASLGYAIFCSYKILVRNIQINFEGGNLFMLNCHMLIVVIVPKSRCKPGAQGIITPLVVMFHTFLKHIDRIKYSASENQGKYSKLAPETFIF